MASRSFFLCSSVQHGSGLTYHASTPRGAGWRRVYAELGSRFALPQPVTPVIGFPAMWRDRDDHHFFGIKCVDNAERELAKTQLAQMFRGSN